MGIFRQRARQGDAVTAARTLPAGVAPIGLGALTLAGITPDPTVAYPVTRSQALSWPALNNGLRVYTNITSQLPLKAESGGSADTNQFLSTLDPAMPPGWTAAKTVESLILSGCAYWIITERYVTGFPKSIEYVDNELISEHARNRPDGVQAVDHYSIGNQQWAPRDVIKFPGILPGILSVGAASIRTALANLHAARMYAENPAPPIYLTDAEGAEVQEGDDALGDLQALSDAVKSHGNAYLGGYNLNTVAWSAKEIQLVEARHADAVEAARLLALPTFYVAAPNQGSSLTYSNQVDIRRDVISALASFAGVIEGRLSLPDVTPRGTTVKFDSASFYQQVTPNQETPTRANNEPGQPAATTPRTDV